MKTFIYLFFFLPCLAFGQTNTFNLSEESEIKVTGTSTLHDWTVEVQKFEGTCSMDKKALKKGIKEGVSFENIQLKCAVNSMKGRAEAMDKKIRTALKDVDYPQIIYIADKAIIEKVIDKVTKKFSLQTSGTLSMAGVSQQISLELEGQYLDNGDLHLNGQKTLKMSDFKIAPPSAMFGQIETGDLIAVHFNLTLNASQN